MHMTKRTVKSLLLFNDIASFKYQREINTDHWKRHNDRAIEKDPKKVEPITISTEVNKT